MLFVVTYYLRGEIIKKNVTVDSQSSNWKDLFNIFYAINLDYKTFHFCVVGSCQNYWTVSMQWYPRVPMTSFFSYWYSRVPLVFKEFMHRSCRVRQIHSMSRPLSNIASRFSDYLFRSEIRSEGKYRCSQGIMTQITPAYPISESTESHLVIYWQNKAIRIYSDNFILQVIRNLTSKVFS